MNERIKELYIQSLQETRLACRPDLGSIDEEVINKILDMELRSNGIRRFAELCFLECAKWMSDGNIPDGGYEAERMLKHFGIEKSS